MARIIAQLFFFQALELAINYTQLFHAKRNRVEIISDFPDGNDAEVTFLPATKISTINLQVLSSLRLHPQGWVALSRNTSSDEGSEWCCVHDIQSLPTQPEEDQVLDCNLLQKKNQKQTKLRLLVSDHH